MNRRDFLHLMLAGIYLRVIGCAETRKSSGTKKQHIVCVLIDQLRKNSADKWALQLTRLSKNGVRFEQMRSVAPWTYPSVISMMSGLYPQQHGADGHMLKKLLTYFSSQVPLIQKILQNNGYWTAAFITNPYLHTWNNFHHGFDYFVANFVKNIIVEAQLGSQFAIPEKMFSPYVNASIKKLFSTRPVRQPEFTYIHYIDVHGPWKGAPFKRNYKSSVQFIDQRIAEIYQFFMERYDGDVFFFVTSDHGLSLRNDLSIGEGPKWRKKKASCHDFNIHIPFMVLPSRNLGSAQQIRVPCSNVDFVPTILDLIGIRAGYNHVGQSLASWIRGETVAYNKNRPIYSKVSAFGAFSDSLIYNNHKLIRYFDLHDSHLIKSSLFDIADDPRETKVLQDDSPELVMFITRESGTQGLVFPTEDMAPSKELQKQLRSLGYLE